MEAFLPFDAPFLPLLFASCVWLFGGAWD